MYLEYAEAASFISYGSQAHSLEQKFPRILFHITSSWDCQKWLLYNLYRNSRYFLINVFIVVESKAFKIVTR